MMQRARAAQQVLSSRYERALKIYRQRSPRRADKKRKQCLDDVARG